MKLLGLKGNQQLFNALVAVYFVLFVCLVFAWNVLTSGFIKNGSSRRTYDLNDGNQSKYRHYTISTAGVHNKTEKKMRVFRHRYFGHQNCSVTRLINFMGMRMSPSSEPLCTWIKNETNYGNFKGYANEYAHLHDVLIHPEKAEGKKGGENLTSVWNQSEKAEYLELKAGYFSLYCNRSFSYAFTRKNHLNDWMKVTRCDRKRNITGLKTINGLTIAVKRYEYVNLYHTMTDYYNAFLMLLIFDMDPNNTTILWIDAHPYGSLDPVWQTLFSSTIRAGTLKEAVLFEDMVWNVMGYDSPLNHHDRPFVPYLEEFREFFLTRHSVSTTKPLNCSKLNVMFIWRRDYIAHPRNPSGLVKRKIQNENELLETIRKAVPGHNVTGVQLDSLPMKQQLELIARTDVFLGMHGAGLAHTLFLPKHAGLIELYPVYWSAANRHFRAMAQWRGLHYQLWQNMKLENEKDRYYTYIPPDTVLKMFLEIKSKMCKINRR